jgi:hypothetical protein
VPRRGIYDNMRTAVDRVGFGKELKKIRSVILFATPNRGSTLFQTARGIVSHFCDTPQEKDLEVLSDAMAAVSDTIVENIIKAETVDSCACPIPFRVFWGLQDNVVKEVSAKGPFAEASPLPGDHSDIIRPPNADDERFRALKESLLRPVGHPCIYEVDLFAVRLKIQPLAASTITLNRDVARQEFIAVDKASRDLSIRFSKQNRCSRLYEQAYRSNQGYVELAQLTPPNLATDAAKSEYHDTSKKFTYVFQPEPDTTFNFALDVYNGFGEGQRNWHNHMDPKANYHEIQFTLDLQPYRQAGYKLTQQPAFYYYDQGTEDHVMCAFRSRAEPLPPVSDEAEGWLRTWKLNQIHGGIIDVVWDLKAD